MKKKTIKDVNLKNKSVLIRVDYNVPLKQKDEEIVVSDGTRIDLSIPTIKYVLKQDVKRLVLFSHLGKPEGERVEELSMKSVAKYLEERIGREILFFDDFIKKEQQEKIQKLNNGEVIMLENTRFWEGEELNKANFANKITDLGDVFVNDAFGSCHRAHASVVGPAENLPTVAGLLLEKEIEVISRALENPKRPMVVILGGAKATTKIPVIEKLMKQADYMLLGGGVANTFLKAFGYNVGRSFYSKEVLRISQNLIWKATRANTKLYLPNDVVIGNLGSEVKVGVVAKEEIPMQYQALDLGPESQKEYAQIIATAGTIIWNGPVGACETKGFDKGTEAIYKAIVANDKAVSVVGGGDTLASLSDRKDQDKISHISTGGGAMLEFIEKGDLPGLEVIPDKK